MVRERTGRARRRREPESGKVIGLPESGKVIGESSITIVFPATVTLAEVMLVIVLDEQNISNLIGVDFEM